MLLLKMFFVYCYFENLEACYLCSLKEIKRKTIWVK